MKFRFFFYFIDESISHWNLWFLIWFYWSIIRSDCIPPHDFVWFLSRWLSIVDECFLHLFFFCATAKWNDQSVSYRNDKRKEIIDFFFINFRFFWIFFPSFHYFAWSIWCLIFNFLNLFFFLLHIICLVFLFIFILSLKMKSNFQTEYKQHKNYNFILNSNR